MGNWCAICKRKTKVVKIVKMDGKILELKAPITVKDLLVNFSGFGVSVSESPSQHLPSTHELKRGKMYYLLPSPISTKNITPTNTSSAVETERVGGVKRIKVVITKQQLQELLSKQLSVKDVLSGFERKTCSSVDSPSTCWKSKLEPIQEGSE